MTTSRPHHLWIIFKRSMQKKPPTSSSPSAHRLPSSCSGIVIAFPKAPTLITAVEARRIQYDKLTENDTVAATAHDLPDAFETILQVLPRTKVIAVVNGAQLLRAVSAQLAGHSLKRQQQGSLFWTPSSPVVR